MAILHTTELKKGKGKKIYNTIVFILSVGIVFQCFTFIWMLSNAFKENAEIIKLPLTFIPKHFYFNGFMETFQKFRLWENIWNTIILCGGVIVIQITISALAAFSLSKLKPKYGDAVLLFFVGTLMISPQALMFPLNLMMSNLPIFHVSLINNHWSYIIASSAWAYSIFLFKGFFDSLPKDLVESARIDGANSFRIFAQIILPLTKPVIAVNILNTFIAVYNDYILTQMLLPNQGKWPIMVRVFAAQNSPNTTMNNIYVLLTLTTIPVILIYLVAQKSVVEGISMTGLKG